MGVQENGLTLEGLAQRLEALERENTELRSKVTMLEGSGKRPEKPADTRSSETRQAGEPVPVLEGRVSRRSLLTKAGVAAVAVAAAGTFLHPREAKAHHFIDGRDYYLLEVDSLSAHQIQGNNDSGNTAVYGITTSASPAVDATNHGSGPGVRGNSETAAVEGIASGLSGTGVEGKTKGSNGTGVRGTGRYGVWGESNQAGFYGVTGRNTKTDGTGVRGVGAGSGVKGESINSNGHGVHGKGKNGVFGESSTPGQNGVWGQHTNQGAGVSGVGRVGVIGFSHENGWNAVWGRHTTNGRGVAGDSAQGVGVLGESTSGIGGEFKGGKAQLRLVPGGVAGKPTSGTHTKGEVYMDSKGTLFVCTAGDGTTVGTWKKVNMKLV